MGEKDKGEKRGLSEEDEPVEWPDEVWERAEFAIGEKVIRPATGTLTRSSVPSAAGKPVQRRKRRKQGDSDP